VSINLRLGLLRPTTRDTVRAAAALLEHHSGAQGAPVVIWQGMGEGLPAFDARVALARSAVPENAPLIAVESGRRSTPAPAGVTRAAMAPSHFDLLHPSRPARYRCATGGRGSGKSHSFATGAVLLMLSKRIRILCAREIQRSLRESVHRLLVDRIDALGLSRFFDVTDNNIACTATGSEVIFTGLYANVSQIKSLEGVGLAWVEEAESASARSLELLTPTVRQLGSEIWFSLNPDAPDAPAMAYATKDRPGCRHSHTIYTENPWCPPELTAEAEYLRGVDSDAFAHVWLGECRTATDAQILRGKYVVEDFTPAEGWSGPYLGCDWGFSQDPTTLVRCWVHGRRLMIEHEAYQVGCDIDRTPALFDTVPGARDFTIRADCARPETISYMQRNGYYRVAAVEKWAGSVEDGIAHLRQYEQIVIHSRCRRTAEEARLYSYKVDRLSGDILPVAVDANNHCMDAIRYALGPLIRKSKTGMLDYIAQVQAEAKSKG